MNNKEEQFVTKKPYERRGAYLQRCIPKLIEEGYDRAQAAAICNSDFDRS